MRIVLASLLAAAAACTKPSVAAPPRAAAPAVAPAAAPVAAPVANVGPVGHAAAKFPKVDFDGDGRSDLAFSAVDRPGEQCKVERDGKVCWRPPGVSRMVVAVFLGRDRGALSQTIELATGPEPLAMERSHEVGGVGDLDGDGRTELAVHISHRGAERLLLLRGTRGGLSEPYAAIALPKLDSMYWYSVRPRPAGDVDGDGRSDVVIGPAILRGAGGGKLHDPELVDAPSGTTYPAPYLLPVGDVTADGVDDLVIAQGAPSWQVRTWLRPSKSTTPIALAVPGLYEAWDLDGDGKSELVGVVRAGGKLVVTTYTLARTGATAQASIDVPADDVHGIAMADTDGSGVRDIAIVASIGRVDVPCAIKCTGPANVHVRVVRGGPRLALVPGGPPRGTFSIGGQDTVEVRAVGDVDGDGIEEVAEVRRGAWHIARSGGGDTTIAPKLETTPREVEVLTHYAHFDPGH